VVAILPPWRKPRGKSMVSLVNSNTNATSIGWHLWEIDLRFAPGLPPGWLSKACAFCREQNEEIKELLRCARCKGVHYCSAE